MTRGRSRWWLFSGARSLSCCCSTYGSKNEALQLPPPVSLGIRDDTATVGPSDAVTNGRVRADLRYCSRRIRGEMHLRARLIKAKEGGCYLPPRCPLLAIRGWTKRRCRCRDADRRRGQRYEAITALVNAQIGWNQRRESHLFSPGCGSCTWCLSSWWPLSSLDLNRSDSSQTAGLLSSRARTDGWRGRAQMEDKAPPLRDSANHTAGGPSLTLEDI